MKVQVSTVLDAHKLMREYNGKVDLKHRLQRILTKRLEAERLET